MTEHLVVGLSKMLNCGSTPAPGVSLDGPETLDSPAPTPSSNSASPYSVGRDKARRKSHIDWSDMSSSPSSASPSSDGNRLLENVAKGVADLSGISEALRFSQNKNDNAELEVRLWQQKFLAAEEQREANVKETHASVETAQLNADHWKSQFESLHSSAAKTAVATEKAHREALAAALTVWEDQRKESLVRTFASRGMLLIC